MADPTADHEADAEARRREAVLSRLTAKLRRADRLWSLLPEGSRVAVGVSGGRDSLALVRLLVAHNQSVRRPLELVAVHCALTTDGPSDPLPERIRGWLSGLGVGLEEIVPRLEPSEERPLDCFRCARLRRRALLETARALGCPLLALGHHADDVVETWLVSMLYTGTAKLLAPRRVYFGGTVTLVRPLYEIRCEELHRLVRLVGAPEPVAPCARETSSRRARAATLLRTLGGDERLVRRQLFWAVVRTLNGGAGPASVLP